MPTVAYQGEPGAYGEAALRRHFAGREVRELACTSFAQVFAEVASGGAEAGVVPIENSLAGSVLENYDLLLEHNLEIVGEVRLDVRHCLLALPGARRDQLVAARSHPQALAQCMPYLRERGLEPVATYNTSAAAREVAQAGDPTIAAIASRRAADVHGLDVVEEGIQTRDDNNTRFFVIAATRPAALAGDKASLVYTTANAPGALQASLEQFSRRGFNLTKLESRPTRGTPWEYNFYVDVERTAASDLRDGDLDQLLADLQPVTEWVRVLGVYPFAAAPPA